MSKFCGNCGNEIESGTLFCQNCGDSLSGTSLESNSTTLTNKKNKMLIPILIVVVLVGGFLIKTVGNINGYERVAEKSITYLLEGKTNKIRKYMAYDMVDVLDDIIELRMEKEDMSRSEFYEDLDGQFGDIEIDNAKDLYNALYGTAFRMLENLYDDFSFDVEVVESEEIDEDELKDILGEEVDMLEEADLDVSDYFKEKKVKKAYNVTCEVELKSDDSETEKIDIVVVKYKGDWCILPMTFAQDIIS